MYRRRHETVSDVRLPAMSLGLRLCASREGGTGGALSLGNMAASGLELGGPFLSSHLVGPPFLAVKRFSRSRRAMVGRDP